MQKKDKLKFPPGFLWGSATSAHQIEGNNKNSDWWAWEHSYLRVHSIKRLGKNPEDFMSGLAADSWHKFEEDFSIAQELGQNAHRLSVEWAKIEPKEGEFSESALDHYEKVFQSAKFHGLKLFVTLHHYTVPLWFAKKGGFENKHNIDSFVRYGMKVAERLGEYADFWITFNEPELYSILPFLTGKYPPQKRSPWTAYKVARNLIRSHNILSQKLKLQTGKPVSIAFHISDLQPENIWSIFTTNLLHYFANEYFLKRTLAACDFIGVNYYNHHHVGFLGPRKHSHSGHEETDVGWGIHPDGIERVLLSLKKYQKPIYITENGLADAKDTKREKFIVDHLYFVHRAIEQGAEVKSYLYWSLIDNFEWTEGYDPKFGLVAIDRQDMFRRRVRHSALKFAEICKNNYLEH